MTDPREHDDWKAARDAMEEDAMKRKEHGPGARVSSDPTRAAAAVQWDELRNLVTNYPVWPGDTVSHASMNRLGDLGLAVRHSDGWWIPTAAGLRRYEAGPLPGDKGVQNVQ